MVYYFLFQGKNLFGQTNEPSFATYKRGTQCPSRAIFSIHTLNLVLTIKDISVFDSNSFLLSIILLTLATLISTIWDLCLCNDYPD